MVGEPLRGLGTDAGQAREGLDEARDGLDQRCGHGPAYIPGSLRPPVSALIFDSASCLDVDQGIVDRRDDEVLQHLHVVRVDGGRIDRDRHQPLLTRRRRLDDAAAGRPVDHRGLEFLLDASQLLHHLLLKALQVAHVHGVSPCRGVGPSSSRVCRPGRPVVGVS